MTDRVASRWSWLGARLGRGLVLAVLGAILAGGASASPARADGDPASDYLLSNRVFLGSQSASVSRSQQELLNVVAAANRAGFGIRVAVIPSDYELGSITALWRKPRIYARFLGLELSLVYKQRLLVVMPDGFGFNWPGHSPGSSYRLLAGVPVRPGGGDLDGAAQAAVIRLAGAAGVKLAAPAGGRAGRAAAAPANGRARRAAAAGGGERGVVIAAIVLAVVLAVALALALTLRRRRSARPVSDRSSPSRGSPIPVRWAVLGLAILCGVAVAVPLVVVRGLRTATASDVAAGTVVTPPPVSWPAGRRAAPDFVLRDQDGRRVSINAYRGRPVIVTFIDPLCRNLCPLEAHVLNAAVGQMPAAERPAILAVSVDVYADARADLLQDQRRWELVPQWRWAVGRPAQLAAVWRRYEIGVKVTTRRIAGTTIKYVTHTEGAYIIDATGHERALFLWPFWPQDVEHSLRELT